MTSPCLLIDLLRHGATAGDPCYRGSRDDVLLPEGWTQMCQAFGEDRPWTRLVSSPLRRCRTFAEDLAQRRALPIELDDRWREIHFGAWEGKTAEELLATDPERIRRFWADPESQPPPDGETLADFRHRVLEAWHQLCAGRSGDCPLVVTHAGPIRVILGHVLGLTWTAAWALPVPHAYHHRLQLYPHEGYGGMHRRCGDRERS